MKWHFWSKLVTIGLTKSDRVGFCLEHEFYKKFSKKILILQKIRYFVRQNWRFWYIILLSIALSVMSSTITCGNQLIAVNFHHPARQTKCDKMWNVKIFDPSNLSWFFKEILRGRFSTECFSRIHLSLLASNRHYDAWLLNTIKQGWV